MTVIGITGPTGAGKTTALNALRALGVEVLDADAVYHWLLRERARRPLSGRPGPFLKRGWKSNKMLQHFAPLKRDKKGRARGNF